MGMAIAVSLGVWVAYRQLGAWKQETISRKHADFGEELVAAVSDIKNEIKSIRSPIGYGPPEGEEDDGTYDYVRRLKQLAELDEEYANLHRLGIRQRAIIGSEDVKLAIEAIFEARVKLIVALNGMIRHIRRSQSTRFGESYDERTNDRVNRYDEVIWENYAEETDPINSMLDTAEKTIVENMVPLIRMES